MLGGMTSRVPFAIVFATTFLFCSSPSVAPVVVAPSGPTASSTATASSGLGVPVARAAPPPAGVDPALLKQRAEAAKRTLASLDTAYSRGTATIDDLTVWSDRTYRAQAAALSGQPLVDAANERLAMMKRLEGLANAQYQKGMAPQSSIDKATYFRLDAEIELARASAAAGSSP
jgi:hypothetical protein